MRFECNPLIFTLPRNSKEIIIYKALLSQNVIAVVIGDGDLSPPHFTGIDLLFPEAGKSLTDSQLPMTY